MSQGLLLRIALLLKGIDGAVELVGAIVLLAIPTGAVRTLIDDVLARDLLGPPDGSLARHFVAGTAEFASGNRTFAVAYCPAAVPRRARRRDHRADRPGVPRHAVSRAR